MTDLTDAALDALVAYLRDTTRLDTAKDKQAADAITALRERGRELEFAQVGAFESPPTSEEVERVAAILDRDDRMAANYMIEAAALLRRLDRERQDFYMRYRMECDKQTKESLIRAASAEAELAEARKQAPDGYAYEYLSPFGGTTLRMNNGEEVNGSKPLRAIPYIFIDAAIAASEKEEGNG